MRYNERYADVAALRPCPVVSFRLALAERRYFCLRRREHGYPRPPAIRRRRSTKPAPERACSIAERTCPLAVTERTADSHGVV